MRFISGRLGAGTTALSAVLLTLTLTTAPARAVVGASISDPGGDVRSYSSSATAVQRRQIDIKKVEYWRDSSRFYVRWTVADLVADVPGVEHYNLNGAMTVGSYTGFAVTWNSSYGTKVFLTSGPSNGGHEICTTADKRRSRNTTANTITVSIPRSCLPKTKLLRSPTALTQVYSSRTVYVSDDTVAGPNVYPNY